MFLSANVGYNSTYEILNNFLGFLTLGFISNAFILFTFTNNICSILFS